MVATLVLLFVRIVVFVCHILIFKVNLYNATVCEDSSILIVIYNREVDSKDIIKIIIKTIIQIIMGTKLTVTKEQIAENMKDVDVRTAEEYGKIVTDVTVTMKNGFTLHAGVASDPENYNAERDKKYCLKSIKTKILLILEYELQDKMFKEKNAHKTFKPFQKVLVKVAHEFELIWTASIYSHYDTKNNRHYLTNMQWTEDDDYIIPFEGNEDKLGQIAE